MQLLTSFYLPINYLQTITTNTQLQTTDFLLPTKNYPLLIIHSSLPTKTNQLHTTHSSLLTPD